MKYSDLCEIYDRIGGTTKGLEKTKILADFLDRARDEPDVIYLLQGRVFPDYDNREPGVSEQTMIKAISRASGTREEDVVREFKKFGDLGKAAESFMDKKKQSTLFSQKLTTQKVLVNLRKLPGLEGKGTVDNKINLIVELLHSASGKEARYITRTVLNDLRVGVGSGLLRDAIVQNCYHPESIEEKKEKAMEIQGAFDKTTDFGEVFDRACRNKLGDISLSPGKPVKVMLFPKAENIQEAFRIVGRPAAFEFKYDGFRMMINKQKDGKISIFTRRLENVTEQFPDAVKYVRDNVKGENFILDTEAVGYSPKDKKYKPFQDISQRIKRKYDIEKLEKELPVELNVFDIILYEDKNLISMPFKERRRLLEKIVKEKEWKIRLAEQIITDSDEEAEKFYAKALKEGQEGLMAKNLEAIYKPGARVGFGVKIKPDPNEFDLVITGAEYGTGKRAGWLTSYDVSCIDENGNLLEIGKVSTGLKEKPEEGLSFVEMTEKLKPIIIAEEGKHVRVKPEIVVSVGYQNVQRSPSYSSGYALRFPRVKVLRPDRSKADIANLGEVAREAGK